MTWLPPAFVMRQDSESDGHIGTRLLMTKGRRLYSVSDRRRCRGDVLEGTAEARLTGTRRRAGVA